MSREIPEPHSTGDPSAWQNESNKKQGCTTEVCATRSNVKLVTQDESHITVVAETTMLTFQRYSIALWGLEPWLQSEF